MVALPPCWSTRRYASTYFGENQLAPGSIGISPLTTAHPLNFQLQSVRTSTWYHPSFILAMVRSPGFGSINTDKRPIKTRFRCGSTISGLTRYCFTIGHTVVLSLTRWSSQIHTEFHVLRATRDTARSTHLSITGLSPSMARHSNVSSRIVDPYCCPTTPIVKTIGLGYSPFARRY